jgi:hypothetical protein
MGDGYMAEFASSFRGLNVTNNRIDGLMADFSGLKNLEKAVDSVLRKLQLQDRVTQNVGMVKSGNMSMQEFDGWFSELVRAELGKVLGIMRARAVQKAQTVAKAGSASSAVLRKTYKDEYAGNINIASPRGRISSRKRLYEPGTKKPRHVGDRTRQINEYFGPDRGFILRFLEGGTDVRTAKSFGPTGRGSTASWGNRRSIAPRSFFHNMKNDMEQAAQQLGQTLAEHVEKWMETQFKEE